MTTNLILNTLEVTEVTGLTANKDYFFQGFCTLSTGEVMKTDFELFKGEPTTGLKGIKGDYIAITKNDDIYVRALNANTVIVITEC